MSIKNPNYIIENQTRDLPACGAMPQPTEINEKYIDKSRACNVLYMNMYTCDLSKTVSKSKDKTFDTQLL